MVLGLGTGSTAAFVVEGLAARVAAGLRVVGIPTSERTAAQARGLGIPIATFAEYQKLDMTIDGADEVELGTLDLIKGLGRRVAAREDRRRGEPAAGDRRRSGKARRAARRAYAGAGRGHPVRLAGNRRRTRRAGLRSASGATRPASSPLSPTAAISSSIAGFGPIADPGGLETRIAMTVGAVESGLVCRAQLDGRRRLDHRGRGVDPTPLRTGEEPGMRKISLVVSDVDGTLVTTEKALTPRGDRGGGAPARGAASRFRSAAAARLSASAC